jgi:hypothetical protein
MNSYIDAQIKNISAMINVFVQSCEMGATKDDGKISREEEKTLAKIKKASEKFKTEINKL